MRKIILLSTLLCLWSACTKAQNQDISLINKFYERFVFGNDSFVPEGKNMCSLKMLDYLSAKYEYDCNEGECYAIWCFRTDYQDGISDIRKVTDIIFLKHNLYAVSYIDMGHKGTTIIKLVEVNNKRLIDEIVANK
ncbi:MAG: hypothetical protein RRZ83_00370 [Alistipes sp.]